MPFGHPFRIQATRVMMYFEPILGPQEDRCCQKKTYFCHRSVVRTMRHATTTMKFPKNWFVKFLNAVWTPVSDLGNPCHDVSRTNFGSPRRQLFSEEKILLLLKPREQPREGGWGHSGRGYSINCWSIMQLKHLRTCTIDVALFFCAPHWNWLVASRVTTILVFYRSFVPTMRHATTTMKIFQELIR